MTKLGVWIVASVLAALAAASGASELAEAPPRQKVCLDSDSQSCSI